MTGNTNAELRACARCGNMFFYAGIGKCICTKCKEEDEAQFNLVKNYIYDNPSATLKDVVAMTEVKAVRIKSYLREGRLVIPDQSAVFINCEVCGTQIKFGRICHNCAEVLSNEMKREMNLSEYSVGEKPSQSNGAKMRFLDSKSE